jgi:hypothetical protein
MNSACNDNEKWEGIAALAKVQEEVVPIFLRFFEAEFGKRTALSS